MLVFTHIFTFMFILLIVLLNIRSITNSDFLYIKDDVEGTTVTSTHDLQFFNPYNKIIINQQLHSRLPNLNEPLRSLKPGRLNFLHTTDTHGWYLGHLNQRQYSADWGDLISFHHNLKSLINNNYDGDLLLVDTGDRHDGNGLSDLTFPNGQLSTKIFQMLDYDLITVGNHELYKEDISKLEYESLVPYYGERFISTNVQYKNNDDDWVVFGNNTHRYFQTEVNQLNILSFAFLFDFKMANNRINVIPILDILNKSWFIDLVEDYSKNYPVDTIVIFGHIPVDHNWLELYELHKFFRSYFPNTYIQYLGGHSHIRDFAILDNLSTGLQSGRYCETVGFLSVNELPNKNNNTDFVNSNVDRKYIDFNLHSFMSHTNHKNLDNFNTEKGLFVSKELAHYAKALQLNEVYGNVPQNYYTSAADYENNDEKSLLKFLENEILVQLKSKYCNIKDEDKQTLNFNDEFNRIIIINTGGIRYDLYKGEFTKNSLFTISPFQNMWKIIPSVPSQIAHRIKDILNQGDYIINNKDLNSPMIRALNNKLMNNNNINDTTTYKTPNESPISYGYTTIDDFGVDGDDTIHKKLNQYYVPNVIQSYESFNESNNEHTEFTNVVYYDFIEPFILKALLEACDGDMKLFKDLSSSVNFYNDCYNEFNLGQMLKNYAIANWN